VELVDALRPDLVVMDVNMPVMNGFLATMEIKNLLPDARIIVVSADDDPEVASTALESGADDFIPKANIEMLKFHVARLFPEGPRPRLTF
jgi:DNA-binding NarL/FixJ family response regulator